MRASRCCGLSITSFMRPITITVGIVTGRWSTSGAPSAISAPPHRRPCGPDKAEGTWPQSVSDAIMWEARGNLETIKNRLAARGASAKGHGEAHRAVDAAIREIGLALNVR